MNTIRSISLVAGVLALVAGATYSHGATTTTAHQHATTHTSSAHAVHASAPSSAPAGVPASMSPGSDELTAIRQSLTENRKNLHAYEWKETAVVSYKGVDKATTVNSCAYDAAGKLIKTPEGAAAREKSTHKTASAKAKPNEYQAYMHSAIALARSYVPPDPARLEKCKAAGHMTSTPEESGQRVRLDFKDYEKTGDDLSLEVNPATHQIISMDVSSYMATAKDAVKLNADMALLPDGTNYPSRLKLDTPAKAMGMVVTNSDFQKKKTS